MTTLKRLSANNLHKLPAGLHGDGNNLYLKVKPNLSRAWVYRYDFQGTRRNMGLGSLEGVDLSKARALALEHRATLNDGRDPLTERRHRHAAIAVQVAKAQTFAQVSADYLAQNSAKWKPATIENLQRFLRYANDVLGSLPVAAIETEHVLQVLRPLWLAKPDTASSVRLRIQKVLAFARAAGLRSGPNPATWTDHLDGYFPRVGELKQRQHRASLKYEQVHGTVSAIRQDERMRARSLEFLILTAGRASEITEATWDEIDMDAKVWRIPGKRMKNKLAHEVPLSEQAIAVLRRVQTMEKSLAATASPYVFPEHDGRAGHPNVMLNLLRVTLREPDATVHGFRASFRTWVGEIGFGDDIGELALAHQPKDAVIPAYKRGLLMARRRDMMQQWANYVDHPPQAFAAEQVNVLPFHRSVA